jgi:hypothetical protein
MCSKKDKRETCSPKIKAIFCRGLSWGLPLPGNCFNTFLDAARRDCQQPSADNKLTMLEKLADTVTRK